MTLRIFLTFLFSIAAGLTPGRSDETVLYEKKSLFGTVIVTEQNGLRALTFERGGAWQSVVKPGDPEHLELAYTSVAFSALALCPEPRRILVVGLGGGTLPMFLRRHYPDATIDAVEIDPEVVHVARTFFDFREDPRMRAVVADGREFIEKTHEPYDIIFLDAFGSEAVPPHLTTQEFLQAVRRAVRPDGVVVGNIWDRTYNRMYDSMVRTYQEVFDDLYILDVEAVGNEILLALRHRIDLSREELAERARRVSTRKRFRFDLGAKVMYGYRHPTEKNDGRVLRDAELASEAGAQP